MGFVRSVDGTCVSDGRYRTDLAVCSAVENRVMV